MALLAVDVSQPPLQQSHIIRVNSPLCLFAAQELIHEVVATVGVQLFHRGRP